MKIKWKTIAPLVVWLVIYLLPIPSGLNANQWHYFAVFAAVITGLVLESMPVGAVGLIGLTFAAVMGYVESDPNKSLRWALSGFAESTVWLIVGAFVFAIGYHQVDWATASLCCWGTGLEPSNARLGLCRDVRRPDPGSGHAVPNTARSGGAIYPIVSNIPKIYGSEPGPTAGRIGTYVMWTAFRDNCCHEFALSHRACTQRRRAYHRQENRGCGRGAGRSGSSASPRWARAADTAGAIGEVTPSAARRSRRVRKSCGVGGDRAQGRWGRCHGTNG